MSRNARFALSLGFLVALTACGDAIDFGQTATHYNLEAEQAKDQGLLLNIIRAAQNKPLQFTDIQSITDIESVSATVGLSLPFGGPRIAGPKYLLSPSVSRSGGPNSTLAVLNTKEFYQGIDAAIPLSTVALLVKRGFPKTLLFMLLVSEIRYGNPENLNYLYNAPNIDCNTIKNPQRRPGCFKKFRTLLDELIGDGLDLEETDKQVKLGPPLSKKELSNPRYLTKLAAAKISIVPDETRKGFFDLVKSATDYRFCFNLGRAAEGVSAQTPIGDTGLTIGSANLCGASAAAPKPAAAPRPQGTGFHKLAARTEPKMSSQPKSEKRPYSRVPALRRPGRTVAGSSEYILDLRLRSVTDLFAYLGEIAAVQLYRPDPSFAPTDHRGRAIFTVRRGAGDAAAITASYEGESYHVAVDEGGDPSPRVLALVAELLALNNSAKDLPASSVISVIAR